MPAALAGPLVERAARRHATRMAPLMCVATHVLRRRAASTRPARLR